MTNAFLIRIVIVYSNDTNNCITISLPCNLFDMPYIITHLKNNHYSATQYLHAAVVT